MVNAADLADRTDPVAQEHGGIERWACVERVKGLEIIKKYQE